jgi:glycosyl-4,4'-diaponeurosporenoate acyltransferase
VVIALSRYPALAVDIVAWAVIGVAVGYGMHRLSADRIAHDGPVTRLRSFERDGRFYESIGIRRWKDRLPEAGDWFAGGVSKRTTGGPSAFDQFVIETRRAELTHWAVLGFAPFFALWNPWYLTVAMWTYAVVANVPCLLVQRYNRARLERLIELRSARGR